MEVVGVAHEAEAVIMPRLDMTTEEMTILRWMKSEGERVEAGEPLLEVMTEKISIEIDAPASGYVRGLRFGADDVVAVGEVIAYIAASADGAIPAPPAAGPSGPVRGAKESPDTGSRPMSVTEGPGSELKVRAAPVVRRLAADLGVDLGRVSGTGPGGRILAEDVRSAAAGTEDVRRAAANAEDAAAPAEDVAAGATRGAAVGGAAAGAGDPAAGGVGADAETRLSPLRRTIARRMSESWQGAPHVTLFMDVDMSEAAAFRAQLQEALVLESGEEAVSLTWNSFIAWVAVQALARRPDLNATLDDGILRGYTDVHLGMAVDTEAGLLVPVVREAQRYGPGGLARALADMAGKAQGGTLQPGDASGGTFTITNLGVFGIGGFTPIINPPQVAILGVGAVREQVIPVDGQPRVRPVCTFSLSIDHRAADGADGARYLQLLKELLLNPHRLVV